MRSAWTEVESQKAQLDAQLSQVPKNHPQRAMYEQQINQQKAQFERGRMKGEIEKKLRSEDIDVMVPVSVEELYNGVDKKVFNFKRLEICRGCRANPEAAECVDCGRCPPEKVQVPKYGMTPFGRQVVGMKEKEQESRERCREVIKPIKNLKVSKGAKEGALLKSISDMGHQTPGKLPSRILLKVLRGSENDTHTVAESDLYTVVPISLEQALFGFSVSWNHLDGEKLTIKRSYVENVDEVIKMRRKGLVEKGDVRGDLYIRLSVQLPRVSEDALVVKAPAAATTTPELQKEDVVEVRDGTAWRRWERSNYRPSKVVGKGRQEL